MSGTKNDQETLEACQSPYPNALSCLSRVPATNSLSIHWRPHADVQFRVHKQTRIAFILNETVFFQLARQVFLPAPRRCSETQHGLTHFPHHTSAIHQNLRVPTFRWLCEQLFVFAVFSVEDSLCVVCRDTLPRSYGCRCSCKATFIAVRFFITSRSVLGSPHC